MNLLRKLLHRSAVDGLRLTTVAFQQKTQLHLWAKTVLVSVLKDEVFFKISEIHSLKNMHQSWTTGQVEKKSTDIMPLTLPHSPAPSLSDHLLSGSRGDLSTYRGFLEPQQWACIITWGVTPLTHIPESSGTWIWRCRPYCRWLTYLHTKPCLIFDLCDLCLWMSQHFQISHPIDLKRVKFYNRGTPQLLVRYIYLNLRMRIK